MNLCYSLNLNVFINLLIPSKLFYFLLRGMAHCHFLFLIIVKSLYELLIIPIIIDLINILHIMNTFSLFILLLQCYFCILKRIYQLPIFRFFGAFYFEAKIGEPEQYFNEDINLSSSFTLTSHYSYHLNVSSVYSIVNTTQSNFNLTKNTLFTIQDHASFRQYKFSLKEFKFNWVALESNENIIKERGYAFAFKISNKDTSFLHLMKKNNLIDNLQFAFITSRNFILLGGIPDYYIDKKHASLCHVTDNPSRVEWGFELSEVILNNSTNDNPQSNIHYKNNKYAFFSTKTNKIYAPMDFMIIFKETLLKTHISNNDCRGKQNMTFWCTVNVVNLMPNITFILDNVIYSFSMKYFFGCFTDYCELFIIGSPSEDWEFGTSFMENFLMLFDYDNKQILLYSDDQKPIVNTLPIICSQKIILTVILVLIIILSIGLFVLIVNLRFNNKGYLNVIMTLK